MGKIEKARERERESKQAKKATRRDRYEGDTRNGRDRYQEDNQISAGPALGVHSRLQGQAHRSTPKSSPIWTRRGSLIASGMAILRLFQATPW